MTILRMLFCLTAFPLLCAASPSWRVPADTAAESGAEGYRLVPAAPGDRCIVCGQPLRRGDMDLMVKGRRVPVDSMHTKEFMQHQEKYFATLQPRAALFQEPFDTPGTTAQGGVTRWWFLAGCCILAALIFGGLTAYAAITRGLKPVPFFFAGLLLPVFGLLYVLTRPRRAGAGEVPKGLAKVPATSSPVACPKCGNQNHPTARRCSVCGAELKPGTASEASRALSTPLPGEP